MGFCHCVCACVCVRLVSFTISKVGANGLVVNRRNLSHGRRISLCLLLRVKYVISYLRRAKEPKRKEGIPAIYV